MSSTDPAAGLVAYSLRAEYEDTYTGGLIVAGDKDYDVKAALDAGDGVIVTSDPAIIDALDQYVALKHVAVPDKARAKAKTTAAKTPDAGDGDDK